MQQENDTKLKSKFTYEWSKS
uniref:Uncharacterized protein n=1 Tax=Anguilla anguilla TaxID=7936 RepID=A0A0E9THI6_ANGAN